MGGKKKGQKCRGQPSPPRALSDRDIETCRLADHAIEERDLTQLRKLAAVRGLVNSSLRARCWPLLCGPPTHLPPQPAPKSTHTAPTEVPSSSSTASSSRTSNAGQGIPSSSQPSPSKSSTAHSHTEQQQQQQQQQRQGCHREHQGSTKRTAGGGEWRGAWAERVARRSGTGSKSRAVDAEWQRFEVLANMRHRDSQVVAVDVDRSLWAFMKGASEAELLAKRVQLQRLINAAVCAHATTNTKTNSHSLCSAAAPQTAPASPPPKSSPSTIQTVTSPSAAASSPSSLAAVPPSATASPSAMTSSPTQVATMHTAQTIEMQHSSSTSTTTNIPTTTPPPPKAAATASHAAASPSLTVATHSAAGVHGRCDNPSMLASGCCPPAHSGIPPGAAMSFQGSPACHRTPGMNALSAPASARRPSPVNTRTPTADKTSDNHNSSSNVDNENNTYSAGPGGPRPCQLVELHSNRDASKGRHAVAEPTLSCVASPTIECVPVSAAAAVGDASPSPSLSSSPHPSWSPSPKGQRLRTSSGPPAHAYREAPSPPPAAEEATEPSAAECAASAAHCSTQLCTAAAAGRAALKIIPQAVVCPLSGAVRLPPSPPAAAAQQAPPHLSSCKTPAAVSPPPLPAHEDSALPAAVVPTPKSTTSTPWANNSSNPNQESGGVTSSGPPPSSPPPALAPSAAAPAINSTNISPSHPHPPSAPFVSSFLTAHPLPQPPPPPQSPSPPTNNATFISHDTGMTLSSDHVNNGTTLSPATTDAASARSSSFALSSLSLVSATEGCSSEPPSSAHRSFSTASSHGITPASSSFSTALTTASHLTTSPALSPAPTDTTSATGAAAPAPACPTAPPGTFPTLSPAPIDAPALPATGTAFDPRCTPSPPLPSTLNAGVSQPLSPTPPDTTATIAAIPVSGMSALASSFVSARSEPHTDGQPLGNLCEPHSRGTHRSSSSQGDVQPHDALREPHSQGAHPNSSLHNGDQPAGALLSKARNSDSNTGYAHSGSCSGAQPASNGHTCLHVDQTDASPSAHAACNTSHHSMPALPLPLCEALAGDKAGLHAAPGSLAAATTTASDSDTKGFSSPTQMLQRSGTNASEFDAARAGAHGSEGPTDGLHGAQGTQGHMQQHQQQLLHQEASASPSPPQQLQQQHEEEAQPQDQLQPTADHQEVFYYQGLHDVASVLLLVMGSERAAFPLLCRLIGPTGPLRDATRPDLLPVLEVLGVLYPIMDVADPEIAQQLRDAGLPPFFALSWFITWFSHNVTELQDAARLFDLFLSSHPLMPLYLGAVAMCAVREELLACEDMPMMHSMLNNLRIPQLVLPPTLKVGGRSYSTMPGDGSKPHNVRMRHCSSSSSVSSGGSLTTHRGGPRSAGPAGGSALDVLIQAALQLLKDAPPLVLMRRTRTPLLVSVAPAAQLHPQLNCWTTPLHPPQAQQAAKQPPLSRLLSVLGFGGHATGQGRGVLLLFRVVRQLLAVLVRQGGMRVAVGGLRAVGGHGLRWGGRGVSGLGWVGSSLGAASSSLLRGMPATAAEGAGNYRRAGKAPGVQMALVGQPDNTSNSASAAASVHEDTAAEMEHPLSDGAGREGDIRHSRHSSVESSHFQIGMEGVSSSRRGSAVLPSSLPTAAGAGPGGALERHGVEHEIVGASAAGSAGGSRSYRHSHLYRSEGGGWAGSGGGRSVEMVGVGGKHAQGGDRAAAGQEYGTGGCRDEGEGGEVDARDECGWAAGNALGRDPWRSSLADGEVAGRRCERAAGVADPLLGDSQTSQLRFRGQSRGRGVGDGGGGGGGGGGDDAGQSPNGGGSGRRFGFDGILHAREASGGRGLNKTMLSLAATTLSASALAGAYFIATYSKGHRE